MSDDEAPIEHLNRPFTTPRFPGDAGVDFRGQLWQPFPITRSSFIDPSKGQPFWTMFMPGQSYGMPYSTELPNTWPPAGAPLRVPKVVFLTSVPPAHLWTRKFVLVTKWARQARGYLPHWDDAEVRDTRIWSPDYRPAVKYPYGTLVFPAFYGGYEYIGWTCDPQYDKREEGRRMIRRYTEIKNPIVDEHLRLVGEFREAKEYLEAKYPGEIFVQVCEFFPSEPLTGIAPSDELMPKVLDVYTEQGRATNTPQHFANGPTWMLGPNVCFYDQVLDRPCLNFFGTDFLHIYCGYQSSDGAIGRDGFSPRYKPNLHDLITRYHWDDTQFGYRLDDQFGYGYDSFLVSMKPPGTYSDGYENESYEACKARMDALMNASKTYDVGGGKSRTVPQGKLSMLRVGFPTFSGYRVRLHEYDLTFKPEGGLPHFRPGTGPCKFPRGDTVYEDQDWVEQAIVMQYQQRQDEDPNTYGDSYYPGAHYDGYGTGSGGGPPSEGGEHGGYNFFERYPGTDMYEKTWTPRLQNQHTWMVQVLNGLGPKAAQIWQDLIEENRLDRLNFEYAGGSSAVTSGSIVRTVEQHFGVYYRNQ